MKVKKPESSIPRVKKYLRSILSANIPDQNMKKA